MSRQVDRAAVVEDGPLAVPTPAQYVRLMAVSSPRDSNHGPIYGRWFDGRCGALRSNAGLTQMDMVSEKAVAACSVVAAR
jgi:hypothetical protein